MPQRKSLTQQCHERLSPFIHQGDLVVDATIGNGHDTLFLAKAVLPAGQVFGFDLQPKALEQTQQRLELAGYQQSITLFADGHENLATHLGDSLKGHIQLIMFNLGYLPSADKSTITQTKTTLQALNQSLLYLKRGGLISIMAYPGHTGGAEETQAVLNWVETKKPIADVFIQQGKKEYSPVLITLRNTA